jgi:glucokinase
VARVVERGVIGVDLGGTKLLAGAVDADLGVHHRTNRLIYGLDQDGLVQMVADAVEEVRTAVGSGIEAVGFGIPCTFDSRTGMAVQAANAPLHDIAFHQVMSERLGLPVVVDNDANCAVLCEARIGAAEGCSEVVLLTLGTGIGGGLVLGGEVYRGSLGGAAEMGHMVVDLNGPPCQSNCPNYGCLETVCSGTALVRQASVAVARRPDTALGHALEEGRELTGPLITQLAEEGDPVAAEAISLIGERLGIGLVSLVNIFNPQVVVLGGMFGRIHPFVEATLATELARLSLPQSREVVRVTPASLGVDAPLLGAAELAFEPLLADPALWIRPAEATA